MAQFMCLPSRMPVFILPARSDFSFPIYQDNLSISLFDNVVFSLSKASSSFPSSKLFLLYFPPSQ
jgi:hypothetical protein